VFVGVVGLEVTGLGEEVKEIGFRFVGVFFLPFFPEAVEFGVGFLEGHVVGDVDDAESGVVGVFGDEDDVVGVFGAEDDLVDAGEGGGKGFLNELGEFLYCGGKDSFVVDGDGAVGVSVAFSVGLEGGVAEEFLEVGLEVGDGGVDEELFAVVGGVLGGRVHCEFLPLLWVVE
jgi:hypothetical protein